MQETKHQIQKGFRVRLEIQNMQSGQGQQHWEVVVRSFTPQPKVMSVTGMINGHMVPVCSLIFVPSA